MKSTVLERMVFSDGVTAVPLVLKRCMPEGGAFWQGRNCRVLYSVKSGEDVSMFCGKEEAEAELHREVRFLRSLGFKEVRS